MIKNDAVKDRYLADKNKAMDVLMLTLDAEEYLEKCLDSLYADIPVNRLVICDGGSTDRTKEILDEYPRVEYHERPDIRTTGKGYEFLFSLCETEWFALIDADVEIPRGWFDEMVKYQDQYDFYECKRIIAYSFFREIEATTDPKRRSFSGCQMARKAAFENYRVDDDYIWRSADLYANQYVVKAGFKYGKVASTFHYHHTGEAEKYKSDPDKIGPTMVFQPPEVIIKNPDKWIEIMTRHAKALVKYIDPDFLDYKQYYYWLYLLNKEYIRKNNPAWLKYYKSNNWIRNTYRVTRFFLEFTIKYFLKYPKAFAKAYTQNIPLKVQLKNRK